jgi:RimJ/RimL family protein N-acetyltransferase
MPTDSLTYTSFTPQLLPLIQGFSFGNLPFQQELADWLLREASAALARGTKVWLYLNQAGEYVGYSSLGLTRWAYPDAASKKLQILIVPAVAIRQEFWGMPEGSQEERYSSQIMRHLLTEAENWPGMPPCIGLFVHPDNQAATKLYQRFGFQRFHHVYSDPASGVVYQSFVRPIVRS